MDIRQLQYLAALNRERHFTRAAVACNVSQPTMSGRIRQLELELQAPIVVRGQRYQGLTIEGKRVLTWAHVILKNWQSMQDDLRHIKDHKVGLLGRLTIGGIPSSLPMIPLLTRQLSRLHPRIEATVLSHSSEEIVRALADSSIDVGITYLDDGPIGDVLTFPLYTERYCLFVSDVHPLAERETVTWREASRLMLCLLTSNMQNRRIIDRAFESVHCHPTPRLETNSIINLCSNVRLMELASIMPQFILDVLGHGSGFRAIPLVEPTVENSVGLAFVGRNPLSPLVEALREAAKKITPISFDGTAIDPPDQKAKEGLRRVGVTP
ncbi:MAG: LysR family transcriptional regulator [Hyphomicrobium sp.]